MNQLKLSFVLGGALLGAVITSLGGCSDDDGSDVVPKDPNAQAGSGGGGGGDAQGGSAGLGGSAGGGAGLGGSGGAPDASVRPACPPEPAPVDAGASDAGSGDAGLEDAGDAGGAAAPRALSFATDIHPIFRAYCRPCHEDEFSGGHNLAADDPTEAYSFLVDVAPRLIGRVNGDGMPPSCNGVPGDPGCITVAELQLLQSWEAQCYPP